MDIVITIALFAWIQTASTLSHHRTMWVPVGTALAGGVLCFILHPWAAAVNFVALNQVLATPAALASLSTVLFVEATAKVIERFHGDGNSFSGRHPWFRVQYQLGRAACILIRYLPPLSLVFAVFYIQLYAFYEVEQYSFATLSFGLAVLVVLFLVGGSFLLQKGLAPELREQIEYRLLFLQLLVALLLPVLGRWGQVVPLFHGWEVYGRFFGVLSLLVICGVSGFLYQRFGRNLRF